MTDIARGSVARAEDRGIAKATCEIIAHIGGVKVTRMDYGADVVGYDISVTAGDTVNSQCWSAERYDEFLDKLVERRGLGI